MDAFTISAPPALTDITRIGGTRRSREPVDAEGRR